MADYDYSELPAHVIHRIQSLLTSKEAAKTTLFSKSWGKAWSTRPTLDLDESHFTTGLPSYRGPGFIGYDEFHMTRRVPDYYSTTIDKLAEFASKAFRRYEESNMKIETFSLCLKSELYARFGLAMDWTLKALKLGATDITFRMTNPPNHVSMINPPHHMNMINPPHHMSMSGIPLDDVFGSENVVSLCMQGMNVGHLKVIECWRLKSLALSEVCITRDSLLNIFSCCPLMENLSLSKIYNYIPLLREDEGEEERAVMMTSLRKLTSLVLCRVEYHFQKLFLDDLSIKFPGLKLLTLALTCYEPSHRRGEADIQIISSRSLEILNFSVHNPEILNFGVHNPHGPRVNFDVPRIRKFTYEGGYIPELSFTSTSRDQWESHVSITHHGQIGSTWFLKLSKLLRDLRSSKIHLCLHVHSRAGFHYQPGEINYLNVREVENLSMDTRGLPSLNFTALFDALFRMCRPKMITEQHPSPPSDHRHMMLHHMMLQYGDVNVNDNIDTTNNDLFLCRTLAQIMQTKSWLMCPSQFMYGLRHLEELHAQMLFDEVWMPLPLESLLLDDSRTEKRRFRLQLKWKPS